MENKIKNLYLDLSKVEDYKNIANNIFTYTASAKLVGVYFKKYPQIFQLSEDSNSAMRNILETEQKR